MIHYLSIHIIIKNLIDTFITHKWRYGTTWGNEMKLTYSYDSNDRLSFSNEWYWQGYWQEYYRYYYSFVKQQFANT